MTPTEADVYRPEDGLHLRVRYLSADQQAGPRLVVELDPQHVAEQSLPKPIADNTSQANKLEGRVAGPSRLAFTLKGSVQNPLGASLQELLALLGSSALADLRLPPAAMTAQPPEALRAPLDDETAVEIPWKVILAPADDKHLVWRHESAPVNLAARSTLWHTQLAYREPAEPATPVPVRAVWSQHYLTAKPEIEKDPSNPVPFYPLSSEDRRDLVVLTSEAGNTIAAGSEVGAGEYVADPIYPEVLRLTPLGGSLRVTAAFPEVQRIKPLGSTSLLGYAERAEIGRDSGVLTVHAGRLLPFGHNASVTTITERSPHGKKAVLVSWSFITVTEPVRRFTDLGGEASRRFPFAEVAILTRMVEVPADPGALFEVLDPSVPATDPTKSKALRFAVQMTDRWGHRVKLTLPMVWAKTSLQLQDFQATPVSGETSGKSTVDLSPVPSTLPSWVGQLDGAKLVLSDPGTGSPGAPHAVKRVSFSTDLSKFPTVQPRVEVLEIEVPGSAEFAGGLQHAEMAWLPDYAKSGPVGAARAYLTRASRGVDGGVAAKPVELFGAASAASAESTGGLLTPTMLVQGFAHELGVVAGTGSTAAKAEQAVLFAADAAVAAEKIAKTNPDDAEKALAETLAQFLPKMKLLGVVELSDLLQLSDFPGGAAGLPKLRRVPGLNGAVDTEFAFEVTGDRPKVQIDKTIFFFHRQPGFQLSIVARANSSGPSSIAASLTNFRVGFKLGSSMLWFQFAELSFTTTGAKPDFNLAFAAEAVQVEDGPLAFIVSLLRLVPQEAFADPPDVQIEPSGVRAGYSLGLPPLQLGAFALSNLSFNAGFVLPFFGERPSLRLALSSRDNPFGLLVACLGGAGFVAIEVDTAGVRQIEVSLEAQAGLALNLGVAKGKVLARAGIYFRLRVQPTGPDEITLEGFVEVSGAVCVLAIMTYSLTANITLGYDGPPKKTISGRATVSVGVKVLFVKKTVHFAIERTFAHTGDDPAFNDVFPKQKPFDVYCAAFA